MTKSEVVARISQAIQAAGGRQKFSSKHDLSEPYIANVLSGRVAPAKRICKAVGVEIVDERTYRAAK